MKIAKQDLIRISKSIADLMQELLTYSDEVEDNKELEHMLSMSSGQLSDAKHNVDCAINLVT